MQSPDVKNVNHENRSTAKQDSSPVQDRSFEGRNHLVGGWSAIELTGGILLLVSLIIGPLLVGSYFVPWRWPVVYTGSAAAFLLLICSRTKRSHNWWLLTILVWPVIQGIWMWYNAWGEFYRFPSSEPGQLPWKILELDNQSFPLLPGTADRTEALDKLSYIIPCLGLIWGTRQIVISRPSWCHIIAATIFWTGAFIALLGLVQRGTGAEGIFWIDSLNINQSQLFFGTYRSPGIATCFLNISLAFGLCSILTVLRAKQTHGDTDNNRKLLHLLGTSAGVIIIICAVIIAGSKAGMALGVLTIFLWAGMNRRSITGAFRQSSQLFLGNKRTERNIIMIALILITVLSLLSMAGVMSDRWQSAHEQDYSTLTGRMQANQIIMKMMADDGWGAMGTGAGSFYPLFPYYTGDQGSELRGVWIYAHNDYLQTLLEWGWLGAFCFAAIVGGGFLLVAREVLLHRDHHSKTRFLYLRGYLLALLSVLLHAAVDFPFQIESIAVIVSVMLGVGWSVVGLRDREISTRSRKGRT